MDNYLSRLNPSWPAPDYTQGREFYYTAPKKTPAWTYQDKLYYVHHSGAKAELMESGLAGEHPRVLAELPPECPTDSIYVNSSGIFLVGSVAPAPDAEYPLYKLYAAYYDFGGRQIFCDEIWGEYFGDIEDFYISGTKLYFYSNAFPTDSDPEMWAKAFRFDFLNHENNWADELVIESDDNLLGFDRVLARGNWIFLRTRLKVNNERGERSYWVAKYCDPTVSKWSNLGYNFCFNIPELPTPRGSFELYNLAEYEPSSYLNVTSIDLQHGLVWITDGQKRAIGAGTDYFSFPVRLSCDDYSKSFTLYRLNNVTPIKEDGTIAQNTSPLVNHIFTLYYFDGLQHFFATSAREAIFAPVIPANSRNMSQFTYFNSPAYEGSVALFSFFMVANGILYATSTTYDEDIDDYVSAPELWMYSVQDLKPNTSKGLTPLNTSIQLGVPQKPADETETATDSSQDDDEPKIDFTWSSGPARHIDSDTEPDVELSDYDDPEEDIFSGLDLDALDEEPAPSQGSSSQYDNLPPSVQNIMNNSALTAEQKLAAIAAQMGIPLEEETAPASSAPARKAVARRVTPRSTVTRQPSAPGDAKVLTSTDVKYGILTFGKKLADVPVGAPCTLYYNGNTYSCKAHNTTRGRIDGLRRLYIDNPELQEGARVTATYDDDEGEITLTLL